MESKKPRSKGSQILAVGRALLRWDRGRGASQGGILRRGIASYLRWNRGLLLDPWLRYSPAVVELRNLHNPQRRILDVGSGTTGLSNFLTDPIIAVDIQFPGLEQGVASPTMRPVRASATNLPFRDMSFNAVVCMDTLEHLPARKRGSAIRELFRVSRELVIVGFPFGISSDRFDREALERERERGITLPWRIEHLRHGVPGNALHYEVLTAASELRPDMRIHWFGHEGLVGLRLLWKLQFLISRDSRLYGLFLWPLYRIHAYGRRVKAYRRIYVARAPAGGAID